MVISSNEIKERSFPFVSCDLNSPNMATPDSPVKKKAKVDLANSIEERSVC